MGRERRSGPAAPSGSGGGANARAPVHLVGNVNLDIVMGPVEPWPAPGTERVVERQEVRVGGAAGVAAMALQALDTPVKLHARIGDDAFGELVRRELGPAGQQLEVVHARTAISVGVGHHGGERTFFTHLGHLAALDVDAIARDLERSDPGLVLVCGYFLLPSLRGGAIDLVRRARGAGHRVAFDGGWPSEGFLPEIRAELDAMVPYLDLLLPNEAEAMAWTGAGDLTAALAALQRHGGRAVVKRGARGAVLLRGRALTAVPTVAVPAADTVGAGDCFNAALLAAIRVGASAEHAARRAVRYASAVASRRPRGYAVASDGT